jgi:hypothetical protein
MTLSILQSKRLPRVVAALVKAEVAHSWRGGQHPDDWPALDEALRRARRNYRVLLAELSGTLEPRKTK